MGTLHELPEASQPDHGSSDAAFGAILCVLWVFSVARVSVAVSAREVFGAEASIAFICMLGLPWLAFRSRLRRRRKPAASRQTGAVVAFRPRR